MNISAKISITLKTDIACCTGIIKKLCIICWYQKSWNFVSKFELFCFYSSHRL